MIGMCKLCLQEKELKLSHVISNAIFRWIFRKNSGKAISFKDDEESWVEYSSDSWREYLLCEECENLLNERYERDSLSLLKDGERKGKVVMHDNGVTFSKIDSTQLQLFILSIFWRAAVSRRDVYSKVYIPEPWKSEIREALYEGKKLSVSRVSVKISHLIDRTPNGFSIDNLKNIVVSPFPRKLKKRVSFCFLLWGFFIEISIPGFHLKDRKEKGVLTPNKSTLLVPYLSVFDVPELVSLLVSGYRKDIEGKVRIGS